MILKITDIKKEAPAGVSRKHHLAVLLHRVEVHVGQEVDAHLDLFLRQEDGSYQRHQEAHYQRAYSQAQIQRVLEECDLALEGVYQDLSPRRAVEEQGRLLFVARKR